MRAITEIYWLKHVSTVHEYATSFLALLPFTQISEDSAINFFIGGLQREIRDKVLSFGPNTLSSAIFCAKLHEGWKKQESNEKNEGEVQENISYGNRIAEDIHERIEPKEFKILNSEIIEVATDVNQIGDAVTEEENGGIEQTDFKIPNIVELDRIEEESDYTHSDKSESLQNDDGALHDDKHADQQVNECAAETIATLKDGVKVEGEQAFEFLGIETSPGEKFGSIKEIAPEIAKPLLSLEGDDEFRHHGFFYFRRQHFFLANQLLRFRPNHGNATSFLSMFDKPSSWFKTLPTTPLFTTRPSNFRRPKFLLTLLDHFADIKRGQSIGNEHGVGSIEQFFGGDISTSRSVSYEIYYGESFHSYSQDFRPSHSFGGGTRSSFPLVMVRSSDGTRRRRPLLQGSFISPTQIALRSPELFVPSIDRRANNYAGKGLLIDEYQRRPNGDSSLRNWFIGSGRICEENGLGGVLQGVMSFEFLSVLLEFSLAAWMRGWSRISIILHICPRVFSRCSKPNPTTIGLNASADQPFDLMDNWALYAYTRVQK